MSRTAKHLQVAGSLTRALVFLAAAAALSAGCSSNKPAVTSGKVDDAGADTWTDPSTGLMWQDPLFVDRSNWAAAVAACDAFQLAGYDDWRLPTLDELRSLARGCPATLTGGACAVADGCVQSTCWSDVCQGCAEMGGPSLEGCYRLANLNGDCMTSWTSSVVPDMPDEVWTVGFGGCHILHYPKAMDVNTRCVR